MDVEKKRKEKKEKKKNNGLELMMSDSLLARYVARQQDDKLCTV